MLYSAQIAVSLSPIVIASQIAELPAEAQELAAEFVLMLRKDRVEPKPVAEPKAAPTDRTKLELLLIWDDSSVIDDIWRM